MKTIWKKYRKYIIIALILFVVVWLFWPKQKKTEYTTEKIKLGTVEQIVSVTGTVEADPKVTLHFQKPGKIQTINVAVGNNVNVNSVLAALDTKTLEIQVASAKAGVDLARANLNLRLAGASHEDINVSQKQIDSAMVAYNAALVALEDTKKSTAENEVKAKLSVSTAEVALNNAKTQYDNAVKSGETTTDTSSQALVNAYENAKTAVNLCLILGKEITATSDSYLGIDQTSVIPNADTILGALNPQVKIDAENYYNSVKYLIPDIEKQYASLLVSWKADEVDLFLPQALTTFSNVKQLAHTMYGVLDTSVPSSGLSQTTLDSYKSIVTQQETTMTNYLNSLQVAQQAITNAKLGLSSTGVSTSSAVDNAKAVLDTAQNNYDTTQRTLEQTKIENQKVVNLAQADVDLKRVAIDSARAAYNLKTASPRSVDVAGLKAQVAQADGAYQLALQNLHDAQIIAPIDGVVTQVNGEVGENVTGVENTIVLIAPKLKIKANVSETDITKVKVNDTISMTLDAFPMDDVFQGKVVDIDPAETVVQGVIYYQITALFDYDNPDIKAGMTVNLDILANKKENVLTISPQAVSYKENKPFVRLLIMGIPQDKSIKMGLEGNDTVEVTEGLQEGQEVILFEK